MKEFKPSDKIELKIGGSVAVKKKLGQSENLAPEIILRNMIEIYGIELLQQEQRLSAMISDLFAHDKKCKKLILLSVKEHVPQQMATMNECNEREVKLRAIKHRLQEEAFLNEDAAMQIIAYWRLALDLEEHEESFEIVWDYGYCGFMNSNGGMITSVVFEYAWMFKAGLAMVSKNNGFGFIDKIGKTVIPLKYSDAKSFREGLAGVKLNGKWGFVDKTGKEVIPLKYDFAESFYEGLAKVELNYKWGFVDKTGKEAIPLKYGSAESFREGLAGVKLNGKWGFIDQTGKEVIPFKYDYAGNFRRGLAIVGLLGQFGCIDKTGAEVVPIIYQGIRLSLIFEELVCVKRDGKWGFVDYVGNEIISCVYDKIGFCSNGLVLVNIGGRSWKDYYSGCKYVEYYVGGKFGAINKNGDEIIPVEYEMLGYMQHKEFCNGELVFKLEKGDEENEDDKDLWTCNFYNGFTKYKKYGKYGLLDSYGNELNLHSCYDDIFKAQDGLFKVRNGNKYGFIDKFGFEIIKCKYDLAEYVNQKLVKVNIGGKYEYDESSLLEEFEGGLWGLINLNGEEITPIKYDHVYKFREGLAVVGLNGRWGFVDRTGKEAIPLKYDLAKSFYEGLAGVELNGKWGFVDKTGKEAIPLKYDFAESFYEGLAKVRLNDKYSFIDKQGNWIKEAK